MIEVATLLLMGVFGFLVIHSNLLRLSIIYLTVFSLLSSFLYLLFSAPELAIAEAAIGSGLVTLLFLAALKRNRVYTVAVVSTEHRDHLSDLYLNHVERSKALTEIRNFFIRREYELQTVFVSETLPDALRNPAYDLVVAEDENGFATYTDDESYLILELELMFQMHGTDSAIRFVRYSPEGVV
ncbi:MAG: Na(+)/H(+) antiporter subunit B [Spirochaetota bacterium]